MQGAPERAVSIAVLTSVGLVAQLTAGRAARDALFLSEYDASLLPPVMFVSAAASLLTAFAIGRLTARVGPRRTSLVVACLNGGFFVVEAALLSPAPRAVAAFAYVHVSVVGAILVSTFASVVNERFDPTYAKTVVAHVGTGAALGGVLGGVAALLVSGTVPLSTVLYVLAAINLVVGFGTWHIGASERLSGSGDGTAPAGLRSVWSDRYLREIAVAIVLLGAVGVFVDYAMKAEAQALYSDSENLLSFFAAFYMGTAVLTFVLQAGAAKPVLERTGLTGAMLVLPVVVALSAALGAVWTRLWSTVLARGSQTIVSSSLFRSGYELLYTPVAASKKRAAKPLIDVACNRIGYGAGSVVAMGVVAAAATPATAIRAVLVAGVVFALAAAWMIRRLHAGYTRELARSLREGAVALHLDEIVDATTLHTFAKSMGGINREELLEAIKASRDSRADATEGLKDAARREIDQLSSLLSSDSTRVVNALLDESLSPRLAGYVLDRLEDDLYARPAHRALARMGAGVTGQLIDRLLSRHTPVAVRRRIPRLLGEIDDRLAVQGLLEALRDEEFEVRYRSGHALASRDRADEGTSLPKTAILDAVERELSVDPANWERRQLSEEVSVEVPTQIDALLEHRADRGLEHVFTLLSLALEREAVTLSLRALLSGDAYLRGTALEYLHNVLPERIRESLWPKVVEQADPPTRPKRSASCEELLQSMRALVGARAKR